MAITTRDGLISALGNNSSRYIIEKASLSNAVANQFYSLWRATGQPGQGAIPTTAATCNNATAGGMNFAQQTSPATSYLAFAAQSAANTGVTVELHDRLAHMGGLNGTLLTAQTVNVDLDSLSSDNVVARRGDVNYSDVQWWLEWYTDTGATASNATVNVTYNDGSSGNLTVVAVGGTLRAGRLISLNALVPAAQSGLFIRDVNTVTLSASTTVAGNFGVTASRLRATIPTDVANKAVYVDWAGLGLPEIYNSSCLWPITMCTTTTTGIVRGSGKIAHG